MSQLCLFEDASSESIIERIQDSPIKSQKSRSGEFRFRKVPEPYGKPDKRGKYAYERFNEKAEKIGKLERDIFLDMLMTMPSERLEKVIEIGELWRKCSNIESEDIRESFGI